MGLCSTGLRQVILSKLLRLKKPTQKHKPMANLYIIDTPQRHDTLVKDERVIELKGLRYGIRDFLKSSFFEMASKVAGIFSKKWKEALLRRSATRHYGLDMGIDQHSTVPGQYPGHLYFHYRPATADKPGSIMFGMEGFSPTDSRHSKTGTSDPLSATGGPKWKDMQHSGNGEFPVPATYNGQCIESLSHKHR
jgi:hypothetical protein